MTSYTLSFKTIEPQKLAEKSLAKKVTDPKRIGYKFIGWNIEKMEKELGGV